MPGLRDHEPIVIEEFNGLWRRGDPESVPSDHFIVADNVQYFNTGVETRIPLDKYQSETAHLTNIRRVYNYVMQTGQSLLVLTVDPTITPLVGKIWHVVNGQIRGPGTNTLPILSIAEIPEVTGPPLVPRIPGMEDFGFVAIAGRAYITPFAPITNTQGVTDDLGIKGQFVWVYKGDGVAARKAAGFPPSNSSGVPLDGGKRPFLAYNSPLDGKVTAGIHIIAVAINNGKLGTEVFPVVEAPGGKVIQLENTPIFGPNRTVVMTKAIDPKNFKPAAVTVLGGHTYYKVLPANDTNLVTSMKINMSDDELELAGIYSEGATPGAPGTGAILVESTLNTGFCDIGFHLVGVVYETDTGYLTAPGPEFFGGNTYIDVTKSVSIRGIPISPDPAVIKRHLVSTKTIIDYNGDQKGYQFFFIPKGTIENNGPTTGKEVNYYDSDLLSDASHLLDNFSEIPAGVNLNTYHSRMVLVGDQSFPKKLDGTTDDTSKSDNRSVAWLSAPGEPEAINKVDGLIVTPLDGNPLTNVQEFRDVLYLFKKTRTFAYSDNFDEPATWQEETLDQGVGAPVHGIATVLDSGGVNIDFLVIADWSGLMLFNGTYARPELSWKIEDYWNTIVRNNFRQIQIVNDSLNKKIWMVLPDPRRNHMLFADYANGLDAKNIRWARWIFATKMSCVTLIDTDKVILGSLGNA